jgi:hypothetical protein
MTESDDLPPGSSRVEFILTPTATGTRLDLVHRGLPEGRRARYAKGWLHFLAELQAEAVATEREVDSGAAAS